MSGLEKIGYAIAFLRKRAGFTQMDLANRIGVSDKAVSKWERGLGLPDVSYLTRLSILLDTDTDSLLAGDVVHHDRGWNGLLILNNESQIRLSTIIFDKPLIKYFLSYFLLVGIRKIKILCCKEDELFMKEEFNSGEDYGLDLSYGGSLVDVPQDEKFMDCQNLMILFGRSFIYGVDQTRFFQKAMINKDRITLLVLPKGNRKNAISFNVDRKIVPKDFDDSMKTQYVYSDIPLLFCPVKVFQEKFQGNEFKEFKNIMKDNDVYIEVLDRGFVEMSINNWDDVNEASTFVRIVQDKCGMKIYCLEEVAWRRGLIDIDKLHWFGMKMANSDYGQYILNLYNAEKKESNCGFVS